MRSMTGETIAEATRPTPMRRAPAMPASSSEKPWGARNWLIRLEEALKKPT